MHRVARPVAALAVVVAVACSSVPPEGKARIELGLPDQSKAIPGDAVARATVHSDPDCSVMLIRASGEIALHRHLQSEEVVYLVSGEGMLHLADGDRPLQAGDLVVVPRNTPHGFTPTGPQPAVMLSTFVPPFAEGDRLAEPARQ